MESENFGSCSFQCGYTLEFKGGRGDIFLEHLVPVCSTFTIKHVNCKVEERSTIMHHKQWRRQPDNLVPLCKFEFIIIIHFFRN